jgi:hypothetical protein
MATRLFSSAVRFAAKTRAAATTFKYACKQRLSYTEAAAAGAVAAGCLLHQVSVSAAESNGAVGGHADFIKFSGNKLIKSAPAAESVTYRAIYGQSLPTDTISKFEDGIEKEYALTDAQKAQLAALRPFVPVFYSSTPIKGGIQLEADSASNEACDELVIENMCFGCESPDIMDVKIGVRSATKRAKRHTDPAKMENNLKKDKERTSFRLGFTITGMSANGEKAVYKKSREINEDNVNQYLVKPFMHGQTLNTAALAFAVRELDKMITHFTYVNTFEIRGASVFFVIDHESSTFQAKLIDLASFEDIGVCDNGFLLGLIELRKRLASFHP